MKDVDLALSDISSIRAQLAASTQFRGIAPGFNAVMAVLVLVIAVAQSLHPERWVDDGLRFVLVWALLIGVTCAVAAVEAVLRSQRLHGQLASAMLNSALQKVLPFAVGGLVITSVIIGYSPESIWLLPGLWLLMIGLLGFSFVSTLPRAIIWVAIWYFLCGAIVLMVAGSSRMLSPWMMGIPFAIGHVSVALIVSGAFGGADVNKKG
jgi:hypothetical protein